MPLPATHRRLVQTDVKMVPAPGLSFRGAKRRGNLLQPVTFSPRPTCYPTWSCEIATGAKRPRNDKFGSRFGRRGYLAICNCPWRSLSAATDAIGFHVLSPPCTSRQPCAGRGMPRPYNARLAALQHFPLSIFHEKIPDLRPGFLGSSAQFSESIRRKMTGEGRSCNCAVLPY